MTNDPNQIPVEDQPNDEAVERSNSDPLLDYENDTEYDSGIEPDDDDDSEVGDDDNDLEEY